MTNFYWGMISGMAMIGIMSAIQAYRAAKQNYTEVMDLYNEIERLKRLLTNK